MWFGALIGLLLGALFGEPLLGCYIGFAVGVLDRLRRT